MRIYFLYYFKDDLRCHRFLLGNIFSKGFTESETETTFHYYWRVCCSLVWLKSLLSKTSFDRLLRDHSPFRLSAQCTYARCLKQQGITSSQRLNATDNWYIRRRKKKLSVQLRTWVRKFLCQKVVTDHLVEHMEHSAILPHGVRPPLKSIRSTPLPQLDRAPLHTIQSCPLTQLDRTSPGTLSTPPPQLVSYL